MTTVHPENPRPAWSQRWTAALLQRDGEPSDALDSRGSTIRIPAEMTEQQVIERIREIADREESLQVTYLEDRPDGTIEFTPDVELPVTVVDADTPEELQQILLVDSPFERQSGNPLWRSTLIRHPDENGRPALTLDSAFDYHISDGTSARLFGEAVRSQSPVADIAGGGYRRWLQWQAETYPADAPKRHDDLSDFWRRYLDGTRPDNPTVFPFAADPNRPLSGRITSNLTRLPLTAAALRAAAARRRSSSFIFLLTALSCAVARSAEVDDTVMRTNVVGRDRATRRTLGGIMDILPVRVRGAGLADSGQALTAATSSWLAALDRYTTPWEYTMQLCGDPDESASSLRTPQILFNFMPWTTPHAYAGTSTLGVSESAGHLGTLQFVVVGGDDDALHLFTDFDPTRLQVAGVSDLVGHFHQVLTELAS